MCNASCLNLGEAVLDDLDVLDVLLVVVFDARVLDNVVVVFDDVLDERGRGPRCAHERRRHALERRVDGLSSTNSDTYSSYLARSLRKRTFGTRCTFSSCRARLEKLGSYSGRSMSRERHLFETRQTRRVEGFFQYNETFSSYPARSMSRERPFGARLAIWRRVDGFLESNDTVSPYPARSLREWTRRLRLAFGRRVDRSSHSPNS